MVQGYWPSPLPVDAVTQTFDDYGLLIGPAAYWDRFQGELELIQDHSGSSVQILCQKPHKSKNNHKKTKQNIKYKDGKFFNRHSYLPETVES